MLPCISSHFRVASCTSRCNSYPAPSPPALISENASKVPNAVVTSMFRSVCFLKRFFGIPCRSKTAISDSISAARALCLLISSKDSFQVRITEFWLSESLLRSPRSSSNRSCTSESLFRNISKYSVRVMRFSSTKAAACAIARGRYPRASSSMLETCRSELSRGSVRLFPSSSCASRGDMEFTTIHACPPESLLPTRSSLVVISIDPFELCGR